MPVKLQAPFSVAQDAQAIAGVTVISGSTAVVAVMAGVAVVAGTVELKGGVLTGLGHTISRVTERAVAARG